MRPPATTVSAYRIKKHTLHADPVWLKEEGLVVEFATESAAYRRLFQLMTRRIIFTTWYTVVPYHDTEDLNT